MKYATLLIFATCQLVLGQTVKTYFIDDTLLIGNKTSLVLVCEHDNSRELVFPNSTNDFKPFILKNIKYFPSTFLNGVVKDSIIYELITYNTEEYVSIKLFIRDFKTKEIFKSNEAKIKIKSLLTIINDSRLRSLMRYYDIPIDVNYPRIFYYFSIICFILYIFYLVVGGIIIREFKIIIFKRKQYNFSNNFKNLSFKKTDLETHKTALAAWKLHMEWLLMVPITTMSSKEIKNLLKDTKLGEALSTFDSIIFGGLRDGNINFAYDKLLETSNKIYLTRFKAFKQNLKKK